MNSSTGTWPARLCAHLLWLRWCPGRGCGFHGDVLATWSGPAAPGLQRSEPCVEGPGAALAACGGWGPGSWASAGRRRWLLLVSASLRMPAASHPRGPRFKLESRDKKRGSPSRPSCFWDGLWRPRQNPATLHEIGKSQRLPHLPRSWEGGPRGGEGSQCPHPVPTSVASWFAG